MAVVQVIPKARQETSWANSELGISMSDVKNSFQISNPFFIKILFIRENFTNHKTEFIAGCFETSFFKAINLNLFALASGRFFGQWYKAATFVTKNTTKTVSTPHTEILLC
jgi:hypothetical protein